MTIKAGLNLTSLSWSEVKVINTYQLLSYISLIPHNNDIIKFLYFLPPILYVSHLLIFRGEGILEKDKQKGTKWLNFTDNWMSIYLN